LGVGPDFTVVTDYRPAAYQGATLMPGYAHREARVTFRPSARFYLASGLIDTLVLPRSTVGDSVPPHFAPDDKQPLFNEHLRAAQRGLRGQQYAGALGNLSGSFSTLDIGKVRQAGLFQSALNRLNQQWAERAKTALNPDATFALKDLSQLTGVEQRDFNLRYALSPKFNLTTEGNDINAPSGAIQMRDARLMAGTLSLRQRQRSVERTVSDTALQGLGRADLIALKGLRADEFEGQWKPSERFVLSLQKNALQTPQGNVEERLAQVVAGGFTLARRQTSVGQNVNNEVLKGVNRQDLAASKGIAGDEISAEWRFKKFTLSELRRTEEVSLNSGFFFGDGILVNQIQRHGLAMNLSPSATLQMMQETVTSQPKDEDDASSSVQRTQTVQLSQKISKATSASVSRQQSTLTDSDRVVRAHETATQVRTGYGKLARLMADWRQRNSSDGRDSGGMRFSLGLTPSSSFTMNALWQNESSGMEQRSSQMGFSLSKQLGADRQFSALTSTRRTLSAGVVAESQNQMMALNPWRGSLLEFTRTLQVNNAKRLERSQLMFRQPFSSATHLVLRGVMVENDEEDDFSHGVYLETKQKRMTVQVGQEELLGINGRFQPVNFVRVAAKPHAALAFDWGMADRRDLAHVPIPLTDWKLESALWGVKLAAREMRNKPIGSPKESVLPTLLNGVNQVSERAYSVTLPPLFGMVNLSGAYISNEDLRTGAATDGYTFALSDKPGGTVDVSAKYTLGKQLPALGLNDYRIYELNYRYYLNPDYFVTLSGRSLQHEDPTKKHYNFDLSFGWKW
jgi:hypothetical protein